MIEITKELLISVGFKPHKEGYLYDSDKVDLFVKKSGLRELIGGKLHPTNEWSIFIDRTGREDIYYLHELNEVILPELGFELNHDKQK